MELTTLQHSLQAIGMAAPAILAVDDHEDCLILLANVLELMGCICLTARDGREALSQMRAYKPDLMLLDIVLPDINGIELLAQMRWETPEKKVPAIAVTGLTSREDRARIQRAGFDDYLCKPFLIGDLEKLLHRHLDGRLAPECRLESVA